MLEIEHLHRTKGEYKPARNISFGLRVSRLSLMETTSFRTRASRRLVKWHLLHKLVIGFYQRPQKGLFKQYSICFVAQIMEVREFEN